MFFNIQRWSLHDGPGIRTTIFFKGCPLRCRWCSNPESWGFEKQLLVWTDRCTGCGTCIPVCPVNANTIKNHQVEYDRQRCIQCGSCAAACPENAREMIGQDMSSASIIRAVEKDAVFYRSSGGGVTFSGGEPFARIDTLQKLARACSLSGIPVAVETSGFFSLREADAALEWIDDIFIDLKHTNDSIHKELTGVSNRKIIKNIKDLDHRGRRLTLRVPLIKDLTATEKNITGIVKICAGLRNLIKVELLVYHNLGAGKYAALDLPFDNKMTAPDPQTILEIQNQLQSRGIRCSFSKPA